MSQISYRRSFTVLTLGMIVAIAYRAGVAAPPDKKAAPERKFTAEELAFYEKEVQPILDKNCFRCHGKEKVKGGFRLNTREGIFKGGDTGPAVDLEKPEASILIQAIQYKEGLEMPPNGKLPAKDIDIITPLGQSGRPYSA